MVEADEGSGCHKCRGLRFDMTACEGVSLEALIGAGMYCLWERRRRPWARSSFPAT